MQEDYEIGQEAFYYDGGAILRVGVLESSCDEKWEKYKLEVKEVVRPSKFSKPPEIGETFSCDKLRGVSCGGLWHILDY